MSANRGARFHALNTPSVEDPLRSRYDVCRAALRRVSQLALEERIGRVGRPEPEPWAIALNPATRVSALMQRPRPARAVFVMGHGAGAGMHHPFMSAVSGELAELGIATVRYQFPYMEKGSRRPDSPAVCDATIRAVIATVQEREPELPVIAGGKSFGGRMTSQAQSGVPLPRVQGLAFFGFPLHPPQRPSSARGDHLLAVDVPMLFLQGTRDEFANFELLGPLIERLGARATLKLIPDADHSFHVAARTGRNDSQVRTEILQALSGWLDSVIS